MTEICQDCTRPSYARPYCHLHHATPTTPANLPPLPADQRWVLARKRTDTGDGHFVTLYLEQSHPARRLDIVRELGRGRTERTIGAETTAWFVIDSVSFEYRTTRGVEIHAQNLLRDRATQAAMQGVLGVYRTDKETP